MMNPQGEALTVGFDGNLKLEFHGARVASDRPVILLPQQSAMYHRRKGRLFPPGLSSCFPLVC